MKNYSRSTPIKNLLVNLENKIMTIKKSDIELNIKEQYMLQKLHTLVNLLDALDDGISNYLSSSQYDIDERSFKKITLYADHLFTDFELSYDEILKYYKTIISIYNIIKE
ncbi:hypothetical protein [Brassicibacter mesophilus]|uniref:hypothetical protein n=1 Tax=Brassicibacter mesophilus TaxID=745119 RepID=UPI003D233020